MANNKIHLKIVTPTRIFYDKDITMVIMRSTEGDLGVLAGHQPLTICLDYGLIKIIEDNEEIVASTLGGFAEITKDKITILTDAAEWPNEIDPSRAEFSKQRAEKRLNENNSQTDIIRAEAALRRAIVRLEASKYKR